MEADLRINNSKGENNMKNKNRWVLTTYFLCILMFFSIIEIVPAANPIVGDIKLIPTNPAPKSDITFSTDISGGSFTSVRLIINECNKETGICYAPRNISMSKKSSDTYETKITLQWDEVNSITYHIKLESDGKWIDYEEHTTILSTNSGSTNGSPGFETIVFLIAIIGFVLYFRKIKYK